MCTGENGAAALGPSLTAGPPPPHVLGAWASMFYLTSRTGWLVRTTVRLRASGGLRPACVPRWRPLARRADKRPVHACANKRSPGILATDVYEGMI